MNRRLGLMGIGSAIATLVSGCSAAQVLDHLVAHDSYHGPTGVPYGPDPRHLLDVYQPDSGTVPGNAPVVLFFYGGNWTRGERAEYRFVGEALAANGIIAVVADYRLSPHVHYDGFLGDCALALQWTLSHAASLGGDPARVMVMGHSAGAYNAAMLALDPRWLAPLGLTPNSLAGWIGLAGPYDFLPIGDPEVRVAFGWPQTPANSQPIFYANTKAPRTLLLAARNDTVVDAQRNTVGLANRLRAGGTEVAIQLFDNIGHVTTVAALARPLDWIAPVLPTVLAFVRGESLRSDSNTLMNTTA
ncbi:alpha/beta hydrolase [Variovorax sp. HJSM1_2]|uniref:alpha/beta hydrolase n=1 Tax=Variovorax sp. HJSM1_2 TaxID=3366263 RepID=UPI003BC0F365